MMYLATYTIATKIVYLVHIHYALMFYLEYYFTNWMYKTQIEDLFNIA